MGSMLSRYVRFALLLEVLAYSAAGAWLHQSRGWSLFAVIASAVGIATGWRTLVLLASIGLGHAFRSPRRPQQRLDAAATLRYILRELRAWLVLAFAATPWDSRWLRPDPALAPTERMPVLVVHGYFVNRDSLRSLVSSLEARGIAPVFVPNFRTWFASIERFENEIHGAIERIAVGTGQPRLFVIAHSMGGLGMRAYLVRRGAARIAGLVTLATPHGGTSLAPLGAGENARQMRRGSVFLSELVRMEEMTRPPPTLSIYSVHDNIVAPQETSRLAWARNLAVAGEGHFAMLELPEVLDAVEQAWREAGA